MIPPFWFNFLLALFHIKVLLTMISLVSKSRSVISKANSSLIRSAEASNVLQMILNRRFALVFGSVSR